MESRLRAELEPLYDEDAAKLPRFRDLEKLPYLSGCVREGLRYVSLILIFPTTTKEC